MRRIFLLRGISMSSPVKRIPIFSVFLSALALRFLFDLLLSPKPFPREDQTWLFAVFFGLTVGLIHVLWLWWCSQYRPQYLLEIFVACIGFLVAGRVGDVWFREMSLWYGFVAGSVHLAVITYAYDRFVRKLKKDKSA
jgi:hypothetical protein